MGFKTSRELHAQTTAVLNYLVDHPYASKEQVRNALKLSRAKVQSIFYHYGFTGSVNAKAKYPTLWALGEKIRQAWPKDLVSEAERIAKSEENRTKMAGKWVPKKKGPQPPPDQAKALTGWVEAIAKKQAEPTKGQEVIRTILKVDDDEITRLRNEVTTLRIEKAYLERKLGLHNANAV